MNPELRQTLQSISRNLESANEAAQENIYTFAQLYVDPCLSGLRDCLSDCTSPCFPGREENLRRRNARSRGRAELSFDFYDDWDDDGDAGNHTMGWDNDELDTLLAGSTRQDRLGSQPQKQRSMGYGSRGRTKRDPAHHDGEDDPTVIPSSSYLGFLERLPFKFGGKLRYKPSAADLREHPGTLERSEEEEPLLEEEDESTDAVLLTQGRPRSATVASRSTTNSLSSRGDLIPSDEESDAVPLDEEFAVALERRTTGATSEDRSSGRSRSSKKPLLSRTSTRTLSSPSSKNSKGDRRGSSVKSSQDLEEIRPPSVPSQVDPQKEEPKIEKAEFGGAATKREPGHELATERTLDPNGEVPAEPDLDPATTRDNDDKQTASIDQPPKSPQPT